MGFNLIYWTPMSSKMLVGGFCWENTLGGGGGGGGGICSFSRSLRPDWGLKGKIYMQDVGK